MIPSISLCVPLPQLTQGTIGRTLMDEAPKTSRSCSPPWTLFTFPYLRACTVRTFPFLECMETKVRPARGPAVPRESISLQGVLPGSECPAP